MWNHFRGAFGKEEDDQEAMWVEATTPVASTTVGKEVVISEDGRATNVVASSVDDRPRPQSLLRPTPQDRVRMRFIRTVDEQTTTKEVDGFTGETVMDVAKREGLEPIEGVCGGHLGEFVACFPWLLENERADVKSS